MKRPNLYIVKNPGRSIPYWKTGFFVDCCLYYDHKLGLCVPVAMLTDFSFSLGSQPLFGVLVLVWCMNVSNESSRACMKLVWWTGD